MIYIGNKTILLLQKQILNIPCTSCTQDTEHVLRIYGKAFHFGILYPLKWWSSEKKGLLICKKCGRDTPINDANLDDVPSKISNYYKTTKLPFRHKLPTFVFFGTLLLLGLLFMGAIVSFFINIMSPIDSKMKGRWSEEYDTYIMYVYPDRQVTFVGQDTIFYGNYHVDGPNLIFDLGSNESIANKFDLDPLRLENVNNEKIQLERFDKDPLIGLYERGQSNWRIKPKNALTDAQLKNKILQLLEFEMKKFEIAEEKNIDFINQDPNSPIRFADNGIQTSIGEQYKWRYIFYNDAEWEKANTLLHQAFPKNFEIKKFENKLYERNIAFLKLYIKNIKRL